MKIVELAQEVIYSENDVEKSNVYEVGSSVKDFFVSCCIEFGKPMKVIRDVYGRRWGWIFQRDIGSDRSTYVYIWEADL
jgi:hypothetical protein